MSEEFDPKIIGFCCQWCSYAGADLAGVSRFSYPTNVQIIRMMCSGRVDPIHILEAFKSGADGVLVTGCHPGDCHYVDGNSAARKRVTFMKEILERIDIDPERLRLEWISASEGGKFAETIKEFVEAIREKRELKILPKETDAAIETFKENRIRWMLGVSLSETNVDKDKYVLAVEKVKQDELERQMMLNEMRAKGPLTIREISDATGLGPDRVFQHMIALRKKGSISEAGEREAKFLYEVVM
ncbi:MAG: hydrogenase iron-sulfur subunit [Nitrososphaeria archaeon]|nr:hydrogenase iron-sulfur subunit [Nitrososphaeria archaeon]NIN53234.1 hydrogenase iron-sulfur subunit [Nitrososphaeria archaeon]NIQ33688.1 hydrogenase iron-sulfur subunit [Nitrososphaeria archaeon]